MGNSAPGSRTNPAEKTTPSSNGSDNGSVSSSSPTVPKAGMGQPEEEKESGPAPSVIRRAQLPAPSEIDDEEVYMATFRSGNTVPLTGRELKETLTTDRPPGMSLGQNGTDTSTNGSGDGGSGDERKWWHDVLLGIGRIGGIFLRDRLGDGQELSQEEREALREIAQRRREERLRRQRRNRWLMIGGVVVIGGLGLWLATRSSSAPAPPPPPPPEPDEPEPQEPEEVEITDPERENAEQEGSAESEGDGPQAQGTTTDNE